MSRRAGGQQFIPRPDAWRAGADAPWSRAPVQAITVAEVAAAIVRRPAPPEPLSPFADHRPSAVMLVLADGDDGAEVLLTRRSMNLSSHRGEVSFPGGRVEPGETYEQAALRETLEEVDLPSERIQVVGRLDSLSTLVSQSFIVPVVGSIDGNPDARPPLRAAAGEVDRIFWVPLTDLARADTYREEWWGTPPDDRAIHFFELDDETVWGATARVLRQLLELTFEAGDE